MDGNPGPLDTSIALQVKGIAGQVHRSISNEAFLDYLQTAKDKSALRLHSWSYNACQSNA